MPATVAPRKTSVWVWILCGIFGLIFLGIVAAGMVGYWFVRDPGVALGKILTAANPDAEILNVDNTGRRMTVRDRRTGKEVTLSFDDVKDGRFTLSATDENGKTGRVELGGGAGKLPAWVPVYPGAKIEGHASGSGMDGDNIAEGGVYTFSSHDSAAQVMAFYQDKARDLGMKVELTTATTDGGHISAADAESNRSLVVLVGSGSGGGANGTVTFKRKQ
jgi:hypothetical protein